MSRLVALTLAVVNVQLDTVRVIAGRKIPYLVEGIERRWRSGLGRILDGNAVRGRSSTFVSDALRGLPGVSVRQLGGWGQEVLLRSTNGGECRAVVFVDGTYTPMGGSGGCTIDDVVPRDNVAAIEVYARPVLIPAEYVNLSSGCGVLAIWTRYATENVRILPPKSERR